MSYFYLAFTMSLLLLSGCELLEDDPSLGNRVQQQLDSERARGYVPQSDEENFWIGKTREDLIRLMGDPKRKLGVPGAEELYEYDLVIQSAPGETTTIPMPVNVGGTMQSHWSKPKGDTRDYPASDGFRVGRRIFHLDKDGKIVRMTAIRDMRT